MRVLNVHERRLPGSAADAGALIDSLASKDDRLWPTRTWPRMRFRGPLEVGASGGHGLIRYRVDQYEAGRFIQFRFLEPKGFDGYHRFDVLEREERVMLRHTIDMDVRGASQLAWLLAIRSMHDALIEDALDIAVRSLGGTVKQPARWSTRVRLLRWLLTPVLAHKRKIR